MKDLLDRIHWPQAILLIAILASLVAFPLLFLTLVPERLVDKVFDLPWMTIVTLGIPALIIALGPALAFMRPVVAKVTPDSKASGVIALLLAMTLGASAISGCGASPLQVGAVGVTVSLRALSAVDAAYLHDLEQRQIACGLASPTDPPEAIALHNACVDAARDVDGETVLDALDVVINAVGSGIAIASEIDAGAPVPQAVLDGVRRALALFDQIEAILIRRGIAVPAEIALVVHALGMLVGAEPLTAELHRASAVLLAWRSALVRS